MASWAKCNCSRPSCATGPVNGPSIAIDVAHLPPLDPLLATAVVLLLQLAGAAALLLLLLRPQPAATSSVSATAAIVMRTFMGVASSSGDDSRWSLRYRGLW